MNSSSHRTATSIECSTFLEFGTGSNFAGICTSRLCIALLYEINEKKDKLNLASSSHFFFFFIQQMQLIAFLNFLLNLPCHFNSTVTWILPCGSKSTYKRNISWNNICARQQIKWLTTVNAIKWNIYPEILLFFVSMGQIFKWNWTIRNKIVWWNGCIMEYC